MAENLKQILQESGIVGAGGAGFPTYAKLADGADTLVINAAECESLIYSDLNLMKLHLDQIIEGAQIVIEDTSISRALLTMKAHTAKRLSLVDNQKLSSHIAVRITPDSYPMGDEISLIYQATGRLVKPGNLPITAGVIVMNVETLYNLRKAVVEHMPVVDKEVTLSGNVPTAIVVHAPIGMRIGELLSRHGITVPEDNVVIDGGPAMGRIVNPETAVITKTTKSILVLPNTIPAVISKLRPAQTQLSIASSACCQCTRCTDLCPRHLLGYPLEPHKFVRSVASAAELDPELVKTATLCCGCGICELNACCQGISPKTVIGQYKAILAKSKERFTAGNEEYTVRPEREYRLISSSKWKSNLGVTKYDRVPEPVEEEIRTSHVEIGMRQHIGAPSVPTVAVGDTVERGQMIAQPGAGLSVAQHASIGGKVTFVSAEKIVIEAEKRN